MAAYQKIDPKFKKKWIEALRSGKCAQTKGCLRKTKKDSMIATNEAFCCLGVACTIISPKNYKKHSESGGLPERLRKKVNLSTTAQDSLISANDDKNWSFNRIANWIEKHL